MSYKTGMLATIGAAFALQACSITGGIQAMQDTADRITEIPLTPLPTVEEIQEDSDGALAQCEQRMDDIQLWRKIITPVGIVGCGAAGSPFGPGGLTIGAGGCGILLDVSFDFKFQSCPALLTAIVEDAEQKITSDAPSGLRVAVPKGPVPPS